jgi:endo-1,4-beta-xylanase
MPKTKDSRWRRLKWQTRHLAGAAAICGLPLFAGGCSTDSHSSSPEANLGVVREAVVGADCGLAIESKVHGVSKKGFNVQVKVTNATGASAKAFTVLVQAGQAQLVNVAHGSFQTTDNGYLLSADDCLANSKLDPGQTYTFELKFSGTYTVFTPIIMSSNGASCDQQAPDVSLTQSGNFFTAPGTLNLSATASDNVVVAKVVFFQDGTPIGTATQAPYALSVPITSAMNGRHVYSAAAYDLAGNSASQAARRVLVAINNKFFGTAVTAGVDYANFSPTFNQVTPGNAGKWGSVEPVQDSNVENWNWAELDAAYDFAVTHGFPFKLHTLVWGSQQPSWVSALSNADQLAAIEAWMQAVATRYPKIALVDVVNEPLHSPPPYAAALGGAGTTGYDWVLTAFQMARDHFPNAELLINDYSTLTLSSTTADYLKVINLLKDRGLIDGIGEQGHFYERSPDVSTLTANLGALASTGLPLYISELDLNLANDAQQATRMSQIFPSFWSNPSVVGVTHWGYLQGNMWQADAYLMKQASDGQSYSDRPALSWLKCYMAGGTDCPVPTYVPTPHGGECAGISLAASQFDSANGLIAAGNVVAYANDGSWFGFNQVVFQNTWSSLSVSYAHNVTWTDAPYLTIHLGSLSSAPVATVPLPLTGDWSTLKTATVPFTPITGAQDVFMKFNGAGANVSQVQFAAPSNACGPTNLLPASNFESGIDGWTGNGASASVSSTWSHSGTSSLMGVATSSSTYPNLVRDISPVVTAGKKYQVSAWVSGGATSGAWIQLVDNFGCGSVSGFTPVQPGAWVNGGTWSQITGTVDYTACPSALGWAQLWVGGGAGSTIYLDDVSLTLDVPSNLLPGSNFEGGIDGWTGNGASASVSTTWSHSGTSSLMGVATSSSTYPNLVRDISPVVTAGKKYQVSAWVSGGATSGAWIQLVDNFGCGSVSGFTPVQPGGWVNGGSWSQITGTVDYTACPSALGWAQLWVGGGAGNTVYVDDVSLTLSP